MRMPILLMGLAAVLLSGAGCTYTATTNAPSSEVPAATAAFGASVTFSVGESITFQDGIVLKLTAINDSRCPSDVQCIWAGELSPAFVFYDVAGTSQEFSLGTARTAQVTIQNHMISLISATTEQATITMSKK